MCHFFSCIVTKSGDVLSLDDSDSHEDIIDHYKDSYDLSDTESNPDQLKFTRVEILPPNKDAFAPIEEWVFKIDQRIRPSWFINVDKENCFKALSLRLKKCVIIGKHIKSLSSGRYWIKNSTIQELKGSAEIVILDNSKINTMYDCSKVNIMRNNSYIELMSDKSSITALYDTSKVSNMRTKSSISCLRNDSKVENMYGYSSITSMWEHSKVDVIMDHATISDMWDSSKIDIMSGNSKVVSMFENTSINEMGSKSSVCCLSDNASINNMNDHAKAFSRYEGKWKLICANPNDFIIEKHQPTKSNH